MRLYPRTKSNGTRVWWASWTEDGVTVYDGATGTERWHYRRIGATRATVWNRPDRTISLRGENVVLTFWDKRGWLAFDAATGEVLAARDALKLPSGAQAFNMAFPIHASKVGGLTWRILLTISGLAMTMLGSFAVWTFWFRRPKPAKRPLKKAALASI